MHVVNDFGQIPGNAMEKVPEVRMGDAPMSDANPVSDATPLTERKKSILARLFRRRRAAIRC
jgi:hypothetical protein